MDRKSYRIGLIHATLNSVQPIHDAFSKHAPHVTLINFMDESLIFELNETGIITKSMIRRLIHLAEKAEASDVDGILFTCSSFTPFIPKISELFDLPMLSADYSMLEKAVEIGQHIGVIATVEMAGPTTTRLLQSIADERGKLVEIQTIIIPEAFNALQNGDRLTHDQLIQKEIHELSIENDCIVLAQFSMVRALDTLETMVKPVLTSPEISVKSIVSKVSSKSNINS
ncbi:aspartate/glutamate racemase family protein [Neobacillus sp. 3P2-tot-E-2]|uniref:aspartate/glutamate racemase family protein n=1 Tax=Neobacillus sp. 3P2-tot-E-2 TaxID=3132212 RepID=UPI0039A1C9C2